LLQEIVPDLEGYGLPLDQFVKKFYYYVKHGHQLVIKEP